MPCIIVISLYGLMCEVNISVGMALAGMVWAVCEGGEVVGVVMDGMISKASGGVSSVNVLRGVCGHGIVVGVGCGRVYIAMRVDGDLKGMWQR